MDPHLPRLKGRELLKSTQRTLSGTLGSVPVPLAARTLLGRGERTMSFAGAGLGGLQEDAGKMFTIQKGHTPAQNQGEGLILRSNEGERMLCLHLKKHSGSWLHK